MRFYKKPYYLFSTTLIKIFIPILCFTFFKGSIGNVYSQSQVQAFGDTTFAQAIILDLSLDSVKALSNMDDRHMMLLHSGKVIKWGVGDNDSLRNYDPMPKLNDIKSLSSGSTYTVGLRNSGTLVRWGRPVGEMPLNLSGVIALSASDRYTLALKADGTVVAWGETLMIPSITVPQGLNSVKFIAACGNFSVAIKSNGNVVQWGSYSIQMPNTILNVKEIVPCDGGLAVLKNDGTASIYGAPYPGAGNFTNVLAISAKEYYWTIIKKNGQVLGWGAPDQFKIDTTFSPEIKPVIVSTGRGFSVVMLSDGTFRHFRRGYTNTLGSIAGGLRDVIKVRGNGFTQFGIRKDGTFLSWGIDYNSLMQTPQGLTTVKDIAVMNNKALALKEDGTCVQWGPSVSYPELQPPGLNGVKAISAGYDHFIALLADSTVKTWRWTVPDTTPSNIKSVIQVSAGYKHYLALKGDGTVAAWGDNSKGQCNVPPGLSNVKQIRCGWQCSIALKEDGTLVFWGDTLNGPGPIPQGLVDVVAIESNPNTSVVAALKSNGKVVVWGPTPRYYEIKVPAGLDSVSAISLVRYALFAFRGKLIPENDSAVSHIKGKMYLERNQNCTADNAELLLAGRVVCAKPGPFYAMSQGNGAYDLRIPLKSTPQSYVLQAFRYQTPSFSMNPVCPVNNKSLVSVSVTPETITGPNFGFTVDTCHRLSVSIASQRMRPCRRSQVLVNYQNNGAAAAENSYVLVEFPPDLIPLQANKVYSVVSPNTLRFTLGTMAAGQKGQITIYDSISCNPAVLMGQERCFSASIFPISQCPPSGIWSGASLTLGGSCKDSTVKFKLFNLTTSDMTDSLLFSIYRDSVQIKIAKVKLLAGDSLLFIGRSNGQTFHIQAAQVAGHPFETYTSLTLNSCENSQNSNTRISSNHFLQNQRENRHTNCGMIFNSYDPNDKSVSPIGFTSKKIVPLNSRLEFNIRFQNTGNDTAFSVVVVDTLDPDLDPASFEMGPSSHTYQLKMETTGKGKTYLKWSFNNILLPDSNTNEAASHGMIQFRISPIAGSSQGTQIQNKAGIYFDFNDVINTNTTFTTLRDTVFLPGIITAQHKIVSDLTNSEASPKLYPNPSLNGEIFLDFPMKGDFQLINIHGQLIFCKKVEEGKTAITLKIPGGLYWCRLKTEKNFKDQKLLVK